jgi:hypothetical protein
MPLTRISLKRGKTPAYRQAIMDNIARRRAVVDVDTTMRR